jgi:hypothetical protein
MKKTLRLNKRLYFSKLMWEKRINRKHMPHAGYMGNGGDVHLILGVNGSGINHLTSLLSHALPNNNYIHHPLVKFEPKLTLSTQADRLAIPYHKELALDHPLKRVYRIYAERNLPETNYLAPQKDQDKSQVALLIMKEVHGLLATEALLRELKCHVLFYISDPVILAEQIFSREGFDTPYLDLECSAVMESIFLKRFLSRELRSVLHAYKLIQRLPSLRQRRVQMKILTIALIQHMFRMLAARYPELATIVDSKLIQNEPRRLEFPLVNWLGQNSMEQAKQVLNTATFNPNGQSSMCWKRSWPESMSTFETLSAEDVARAYRLVINHGLMLDEGVSKIWTERHAV